MQKPYIEICKYCLKECRTSSRHKKYHKICVPKKEKRSYSNKFLKARIDVQIRDGLECQNCGKCLKNESQNPPTHHINEDKNDNRLVNLVLLCKSCHMKIHMSGKLKKFSVKKYKIKEYKKIPVIKDKLMFTGI